MIPGPRLRHVSTIARVALPALVVAGTWLTLRDGLMHADEYTGGVPYVVWTWLVSPVLGAAWVFVAWLPPHGPRRTRQTVGRVLLAAGGASLLAAVTAYIASFHIPCNDPTDSGECGLGLLFVGVAGIFEGLALFIAGAIVAGVAAALRVGRRPRTENDNAV